MDNRFTTCLALASHPVVTTAADEGEVARAIRDADALRIPLEIVRLHDNGIAALYDASLTLVRPDQHVAWRGDRWTDSLSRAAGWSDAVV